MPDRQLVEDGWILAVRELGAGAAVVVLAGYAAVVLSPGGAPAGRVLIMALVAGWFAARCTDWRARVAVMVIDALVFVVVTGELGGAVAGPPPVSYTPVIGVATMLGWGYRRLTQGAAQGRDAPAGGADE